MERTDYMKYGKIFAAIMTIISIFLTIVQAEGEGANLSDFDEEGWGVVFALLGLTIITLSFFKQSILKLVYAGIALLEVIFFFIFTFTGDLHDAVELLEDWDADWHWGAGWWMLMISIIITLAIAVIEALPEITKILNNRPAPAPQAYYQQPMQQPYAQPMQQPVQQPYAQPMQQPVQQPYAQPVQQPTDPNAPAQ